MANVQSLNNLDGHMTITVNQNLAISDNGSDTITITGPDVSDFVTTSELDTAVNTISGTLSSEIDSDIAAHAADPDAHHARYTDAEAVSATDAARASLSGTLSAEIDSDITTHTSDPDAHHARYTDAEAVTATQSARDALETSLTNEIVAVSGSLQNQIDALGQLAVVPTQQEVCVEFDSGETMAATNMSQGYDLGFSNSWSFAMWYKPGSLNFQSVFSLENGPNYMSVEYADNDSLYMVIGEENTSDLWNALYDGVLTADEWHFIVISRDGSTSSLDVFVDGTLVSPSQVFVDNRTSTMTNTPRYVRFLGNFNGSSDRVHSAALWGAALTGFDVTTLYNEGDGSAPDYRVNSGTYDKSSSLLHWWRLGFESGNFGKDFGSYYPPVNVMEDAVAIDSSDVVSDFPGA